MAIKIKTHIYILIILTVFYIYMHNIMKANQQESNIDNHENLYQINPSSKGRENTSDEPTTNISELIKDSLFDPIEDELEFVVTQIVELSQANETLHRMIRKVVAERVDVQMAAEYLKSLEFYKHLKFNRFLIPPELRVTYNDNIRGYQLPILLKSPLGSLGNTMNEYASLFAYGKTYNCTVLMERIMEQKLKPIFPYLSMKSESVLNSEQKNMRKYAIDPNSEVDYRAHQLAASGLLGPYIFEMRGNPIEMQLFPSIKAQLKFEFSFTDEIKAQATSRLQEIRAKVGHLKLTFVGVHSLRSDKDTFSRNGEVLPIRDYYKKALNHFREKYQLVAFVAVSDDYGFLYELFDGESDVFIAPGNSEEVDLATLASCNHSIITIDSYGFWSAYLAGGETVYSNVVRLYRENKFTSLYYQKAQLKWLGIDIRKTS